MPYPIFSKIEKKDNFLFHIRHPNIQKCIQRLILNILALSTLDQIWPHIYHSTDSWQKKCLWENWPFFRIRSKSSEIQLAFFKLSMNVSNVQCNLSWQPYKIWQFRKVEKPNWSKLIPTFWSFEKFLFCQAVILNDESIDRVWNFLY